MSEITTHERPGVYSAYEASALTAAASGGGAVCVVADAGDSEGAGPYTWTSYSRAVAAVGKCALSELARLAREEKITKEMARAYALHPETMERQMRFGTMGR